jgi:hypothetical protein
MIKNAVDDNGVISEGIVRIGATLHTLMGHKAHIEVPVIIRGNSLVEPAVFFYDDAPYVMCGPALDDLIKRGSLQKNTQSRNMYSPPVSGLPEISDAPREGITNHEHMFSPGARNPYNFRRSYSKTAGLKDNTKDPAFNTWVDIDKAVKEGQVNTSCSSCGGELGPRELGLCKECETKPASATPIGQPPTLTPPNVMKGAAKEPRKRTNIDVETERPELWDHDVQDEMLDPAERRRNDLYGVGANVSLTEDVQARERGGGHLIVPQGSERHGR